MKKIINLINYCIYILLLFYLFVDSVTGFTLKNYGFSISIYYKMLVLVLMNVVVLDYNYNYFLGLLTLGSFLLIGNFNFFFKGYTGYGFNIQYFIKTFANICFFLYFSIILKTEYRFAYYIKNILAINTMVYIVNIILGILGFGTPTYDTGFGIKGFFYAGNEVFLIPLSFFIIGIYNNRFQNKRNPFIYLVAWFLLCSIVGTKTAILASLIIGVLAYYSEQKFIKKVRFWIFLPLIVFVSIIIFNSYIINLPAIQNKIWRFNNALDASGSIINALLSNRVEFFKDNYSEWKISTNISDFLFGGFEYAGRKGVEMDLFDTFFINGFLPLVIITCFYIYIIGISIKRRKHLLAVFNFLVLAISLVAGHMWTNLTGGVFFIIVNVLILNNVTYENFSIKVGVKYEFLLLSGFL